MQEKLYWFTRTNISTKNAQDVSFDLTKYLEVLSKNAIWCKKPYRNEYVKQYAEEDFNKIKSLKIHIHNKNSPYVNTHNYENILNEYIDLKKIEQSKLFSSGILEAVKIAVIEVDCNLVNTIRENLNYQEEKDVDKIFDKLSEENWNSWYELSKIKSIISEITQFFIFNLHLNFLTHDYQFSFDEKPNLIGFTAIVNKKNIFYETDKIDFFSHYVLYEKENDILEELMKKTSKFWHNETPSIHFFLDALKGNNITSTNFIKLVFTIESFFGKNTSNDFMSLVIPLLLSKNINESNITRAVLRKSFQKRNEIVHGNKIYNFNNCDEENKEIISKFFELKNTIAKLFIYYIKNDLYLSEKTKKINHDMIFKLLPNGLSKS